MDLLEPLNEWRDDPVVCNTLHKIADGENTTESLVECVVELAKRARNAEDYVLIHKLRGEGA